MSVMYRGTRFDRISKWKVEAGQHDDVSVYNGYISEEIPIATELVRNARIKNSEREI